MSEIESVSDEELTRIAKGMEEKKAEAVPQKPYMVFEAGEVVQESGLPGVKYDFNYGARVTVPQGEYRVKLIDRSACLTVYDAPASGVIVTSSKKYFVDFRIEVYEKDKLIFAHDLDLKGKKSADQISHRNPWRYPGVVPLCGRIQKETSVRTLLCGSGRHGRTFQGRISKYLLCKT